MKILPRAQPPLPLSRSSFVNFFCCKKEEVNLGPVNNMPILHLIYLMEMELVVTMTVVSLQLRSCVPRNWLLLPSQSLRWASTGFSDCRRTPVFWAGSRESILGVVLRYFMGNFPCGLNLCRLVCPSVFLLVFRLNFRTNHKALPYNRVSVSNTRQCGATEHKTIFRCRRNYQGIPIHSFPMVSHVIEKLYANHIVKLTAINK